MDVKVWLNGCKIPTYESKGNPNVNADNCEIFHGKTGESSEVLDIYGIAYPTASDINRLLPNGQTLKR